MFEQSFLGGEAVVAPGEAVVVVDGEVARSFDVSVPTMPTRGVLSGVTELGSAPIDGALADVGVHDVSRLHGPTPPPAPGYDESIHAANLSSTYRVRFDPSQPLDEVCGRLVAAEGVQVAEPVFLREAFATPDDALFGSQWGLTKIHCPEAWDRTTGDRKVIVAVVDSGVDLDHPDLAGLILPGYDTVDRGPNPPSFVLPGGDTWVWEGDFAGKDNVPQDEVGHGTHVAGTISARSNNGIGVAGVTWACPILPVRVLCRARRVRDGAISGFGMSDEIAEGIRWAADHGARVINLSLGAAQRTAHEENAIAYAMSKGCVVVAAMGNEGSTNPSYPAAYAGVIAVAATDAGDQRATFSNRGPHVAVSAPGVDITSTFWDNTYAQKRGTSMASPHVAGVAALILSVNPSLTAAEVRRIIVETARPLRDAPGDPVPNDSYGAGLVDARAAVDEAAPDIVAPAAASVPFTICPTRIAVRCGDPVESRTIFCLPSVRVPCPTLQIVCSRRIILCGSDPLRCESWRFPCGQSSFVCATVGISCAGSEQCRAGDPPFERMQDVDPAVDPYGFDYGGERW